MGLSKNEGHDVQLVPETTRDDYPLAIAYRCVYFFWYGSLGYRTSTHTNLFVLSWFCGAHIQIISNYFMENMQMFPFFTWQWFQLLASQYLKWFILDPNHNDKFVSYQRYV